MKAPTTTPKKKKSAALNNGLSETLTTYTADSKPFVGTCNRRELRAIKALLNRSIFRYELDRVVGCTNAPDLISRLRCKGLDIPCERVPGVDRDGRIVRPGRYSLTQRDRRLIHAWMAHRGERA